MAATDVPDLFALITGLCAIGLILIPELVYVRDIYETAMQEPIPCLSLRIRRISCLPLDYGIRDLPIAYSLTGTSYPVLAGIVLFFLVWTFGYLGNSVKAWVWGCVESQRLPGAGCHHIFGTAGS